MRNFDPKQLASILISLSITALCLFLSSGQLTWANAWVLLALTFLTGLLFTIGRDPELSAERRNVKDAKPWDKFLGGYTVLLGPMLMWITAGLDQRLHWSRVVASWELPLGMLIALLSAALISWAMRSNKFFSSVVRIQKERNHTVIDTGPYRYVRHPGYTGMIAFTLATPLILASHWALIPAAINASATIFRTILEDGTLCNELPNYPEYALRVRYKLWPGIW